MQFIRLRKLIDNAERELLELVANWMNTMSVYTINISFTQNCYMNVLIS